MIVFGLFVFKWIHKNTSLAWIQMQIRFLFFVSSLSILSRLWLSKCNNSENELDMIQIHLLALSIWSSYRSGKSHASSCRTGENSLHRQQRSIWRGVARMVLATQIRPTGKITKRRRYSLSLGHKDNCLRVCCSIKWARSYLRKHLTKS